MVEPPVAMPAPVALALALLLTLALAWMLAPARAHAQISPGPLARAHGALDEPSLCFKCHARGGGMTERCLACHTAIAAQRAGGRGVHGREAREKDCAGCHPDHAGRDFDLVRWDEGAAERFDHRRAGYPLTGKHAALACGVEVRCNLARQQAIRPRQAYEHGSYIPGDEHDA